MANVLPVIFRVVFDGSLDPSALVTSIVKFCFFAQLKKAGLTSVSSKIDKEFSVTLVYQLVKIAQRFSALPDDLSHVVSHLAANGALPNDKYATFDFTIL